MIQLRINYFTVIEVIRDMGMQTNNDLEWRVAALMREFWETNTGHPPDKENRQNEWWRESLFCALS